MPRPHQIGRYRQIVAILARHGFGWVFADLDLRGMIPLRSRIARPPAQESHDRAEHLRLAFEELGTTFIKLGQVLSSRPDVLPPEYVSELGKLQDDVPGAPYEDIAAVFQAERGARPEDEFAEFDPEPMAAASIGQVHTARLFSGEKVVVKIQRPGVAAAVDTDLGILSDLARTASAHSSAARDFDVQGLAEEFAFSLRCELDYEREGLNLDLFRAAFDGDDEVHLPTVHWDYCSRRVLVVDRLAGFKISDLAALEQAGLDRDGLASSCVRIMLEQVFVHGLFHADPHPGNLLVQEDGRLGMFDFGLVGQLDEEMQETLSRLLLAFSRADSSRVMDELISAGFVPGQVNRMILKRDLDRFMRCRLGAKSQTPTAAAMFAQVSDLARNHHLRLPSELALMAKVMVISEGVALQLDEEFDFVSFARPYLQKYWFKRRSPERVALRLAEGAIDLGDFALSFPRLLTRVSTQLDRGDLGAHVEVRGLEPAVDRAQRMVNKLSASILVGALIIGLSQFMHMVAPQGFLAEHAVHFFELLFVAAVALGFWFLVTTIRS